MTEHVFTQSTTTTPTTLEWSDYTPGAARGAVRQWLGEAIGNADAADAIEDYRIDLILEAAQRRGITPFHVRLWIFGRAEYPRTPADLIEYAIRRGFTEATPEDIDRAFDAARVFARVFGLDKKK